ncbi:NUDIX hydrolase [Amphibacillus sp. MSJ-3]|uniref:NUDIX domain-containing protein n=1 Tax=Amphibacillus sp. MSJ-3 TaxID=2841505 RepID=UPI001C0ECAD2|nr:NUDIX hydrolase [Amphibacillus sp. MSJ-3]MBU5594281.1 NUDIX hydrolase [Amphibacillus sp. MSJ-3]
MKKFEEKTIQSEQIFSGRMIDLFVDQVELPNGEYSTREIIRHPGAVAVIAITDDHKLVMVEQYRKPLERSILEIPAGKLDPGEDPADTAIRELEEETGYTTDKLTFITSFYTSPGFADEILYLYLAEQLKVAKNGRETDDDEFVEVFEYGLDELVNFEATQRIHDIKTSYAIQYLKLNNK